MSEQTTTEFSRRALIMCAEDVKNYTDFFSDLYQGKVIDSWSLVSVMQMFTVPDDLWLSPGTFLGSIICYEQGASIKWMWVDWEWHFDIRDLSTDIQDIMIADTLRHEFRVLTWGPKNGWQLLGDERIKFEESTIENGESCLYISES